MSRPNVKAGPRAVRAGQPRTYRTLEPTVTDQPQHTPAEAVQYWYDAATERREERDRLRAVVARIRQMADYWEQQLPEVIRTPAVVSALRAALESTPAVVAPPTSRPTAPTEWVDGHPQLEAIAAAVWEHCQRGGNSTVDDDPRNIAAAAWAAVSPQMDRAALRDRIAETEEERADREETERDHARGDHTHCGITCEAEMPTEHLRNFVIAKGYPGTKGALDELLRRTRADAVLAVLPEPTGQAAEFELRGTAETRAAVLREAADAEAEAERQMAAVERVRRVLEMEPVLNRTALEYRGLVQSALMADEARQDEAQR